MRASSHKLAQALSRRLEEILPDAFSVRATDGNLHVHAAGQPVGGASAASIVEDVDARTPAERVQTAVAAVLSGVQDDISEFLTVPWPADAAGDMALPGVRVDGQGVHMWFGATEDVAVVRLRPIDFVEITDP